MQTLPPVPMTFLQACARMEGFYDSGSRPQRNNNPLDLEWCPESKAFGATSGDPRFAIFDDVTTGWDAARRWFSVPAKFSNGTLVGGYLGATIKQAITRFAPPSENNSNSYVSNVCAFTELTPDTILTEELLLQNNE
jgi:hypothetical protein